MSNYNSLNLIEREIYMFMYECPHCHKKTISIFQKMVTGGMSSKGTKCKNCGRRIVNGKISLVVHSVLYLIAFVYMALILITEMNQNAGHNNYPFIVGMWIVVLLVSNIIDGFTPDVEKCIRNDIEKPKK